MPEYLALNKPPILVMDIRSKDVKTGNDSNRNTRFMSWLQQLKRKPKRSSV